MNTKCPECSVGIGKNHKNSCSSAVCFDYGVNTLLCSWVHDKEGTKHKQSIFTGWLPGEFEAATRGWFIQSINTTGKYKRKWIPARGDEKTAMPDSTRVKLSLDWVSEAQMYVELGVMDRKNSGLRKLEQQLAIQEYLSEATLKEIQETKKVIDLVSEDVKKSITKNKVKKKSKRKSTK
mgnify:CR=1 FL=1